MATITAGIACDIRFLVGKLVTFGHLDAYCDGHLFDLKTGMVERDYLPQMAVYAAAICNRDDLDGVTVHILYSEPKTAYSCYLSKEQACELVDDIVGRAESKDRKETPCGYCSWCGRRDECGAVRQEVSRVASAAGTDLPEIGKVSEVDDPTVMSRLKDVAAIAKLWITEVNKYSLNFGELPGYKKLTRSSGPQLRSDSKSMEGILSIILDDQELHEEGGDGREILAESAKLSFPKLVSVYADKCGTSEKEAKRRLSLLFADFIKEGQKTEYWRKS